MLEYEYTTIFAKIHKAVEKTNASSKVEKFIKNRKPSFEHIENAIDIGKIGINSKERTSFLGIVDDVRTLIIDLFPSTFSLFI